MKKYQHKVQYYETDTMGITHHSNYIRWMEEARVDFLEQIDWNYDKLERMGIVSPVTSVDSKYRVSTTFPEIITIDVIVEAFKGIRLKLRYEMHNEKGELVNTGHTEHCFLTKTGELVNVRKSYPEFYEALAGLVQKDAV